MIKIRCRSNIYFWAIFCLSLLGYCKEGLCLSISQEDAVKIAQKIWHNECGGKLVNLTCWNKGENFASLGIGHFIWYPAGKEELFKQTFPTFLQFLKTKNVDVPGWLTKASGCPWPSREAFYAEIESEQMRELRQFLFDSRHWQALFMAERLEKAIPAMVQKLPMEQKVHVTALFNRLENDPKGLYALLDYLNFKGEGTLSTESYGDQGWGLLQVLLAMPARSEDVIADFVKAARHVLTQRVQNSPQEKNEQRWLKGWLNRVDSYAK